MYQIIETGKRFCCKEYETGEVFNVEYFRVTNGCIFEPVILTKGSFVVCSESWEIIDNEALAGKARILFAKYFSDFEKKETSKQA